MVVVVKQIIPYTVGELASQLPQCVENPEEYIAQIV